MKIIFGLVMLFNLSSVAKACDEKTAQVVDMKVTDKGYEPATVEAQSNKCLILKVTRQVEATCATDIQVPTQKIKMVLPLNKTVNVDLGLLKKGEVKFGCAEGMMISGKIIVK